MYIIGENIHIISPHVKDALAERNGAFFTELARKQVTAGAQALDLNIGPRKKDGPEVIAWLLDQVCAGRARRALLPGHDQPGGDRSRAQEAAPRPRHHQLYLRRPGAAGQRAAGGRRVRGQAHRPHHGQRHDPGQGRRAGGDRHGASSSPGRWKSGWTSAT